jgi:hypothetical protein
MSRCQQRVGQVSRHSDLADSCKVHSEWQQRSGKDVALTERLHSGQDVCPVDGWRIAFTAQVIVMAS